MRAATGDTVLAVADGTIERIDFNLRDGVGFGYYVVLKHNDGSKTLYAHLLENSTDHLSVGISIKKGEFLSQANSSGGVKGPHLHLQYAPNGEIYEEDAVTDPFPCINANLEGQITISDNGTLADDAFSLTLDGILIGATDIGASNTFAINNLRRGEHTIRIDATIVPDDVGTMQVDLGEGVAFSDNTKSRSVAMDPGGSVEYTITVDYSSY